MRSLIVATRLSVVVVLFLSVAIGPRIARAQDQESDSWLEMPEKGGGGGHFQGTGKVEDTQTTPCAVGAHCFVFTASVSSPQGGATVSGQGINSICQTVKKKTCCSSAGTAVAEPSGGGSIDFSFAGMACSKTQIGRASCRERV